MNTKFSVTLSIVIIALLAAACAPSIAEDFAPAAPVQPPNLESAALVPVTGETAPVAVRTAQEPRLWSGEVFMSGSNAPDSALNTTLSEQNACISEDDMNRRHGGCVE